MVTKMIGDSQRKNVKVEKERKVRVYNSNPDLFSLASDIAQTISFSRAVSRPSCLNAAPNPMHKYTRQYSLPGPLCYISTQFSNAFLRHYFLTQEQLISNCKTGCV